MNGNRIEITNTFTGYLGSEFQQKLMWQLLVEPEFTESVINQLSIDYFDDPIFKRLFIIINEYYKEHEKTPTLQNQGIYQAINLYKKPNNPIEEESLYSAVQRIKMWNDRVLNKEMLYDGDVVQNSANLFIKQQEYRKLGEFILTSTRNGKIKEKHIVGDIEDKITKINSIGDTEDYGTEVIENIEDALKPEFRDTIPTGVGFLDEVTGGGLGKSEVGIILSPSGVGKTTTLSKIANTAYALEKNVLQIIFEDNETDIKRKHYTLWSKIPLSEIQNRLDETIDKVDETIKDIRGGRLVIKRFTSDDITMIDIKNWILRYQKKYGIKFDVVILDYLDCVESHKKTTDRTEAEFLVVKSFLNMGAELNIPLWTATQGNRDSFVSEVLGAQHQGGSIKRIQKAHFVMSIAKPDDLKDTKLANIKIVKARFAKDGQLFRECIFDNDTLEISLTRPVKIEKKIDDEDTNSGLDRFNKKLTEHDDGLTQNKNFDVNVNNEESVEFKVQKKIKDVSNDDENLIDDVPNIDDLDDFDDE